MERKNSNWLHVSGFIIIWWMNTSLCWKLDNDNVLYTNRDVTYNCALNTMCRCFPNETNLLQISCNEITLYKLPEILLGTVKHLEMSHTMIQHLDDDSFQGLRLESLKLVNNRLFDISEKSLSFMTHSLISLDISGNLFQSLPLESLKSIHTLSRIIAQRNYIQHLDGNFGVLTDTLRVLHLADNSISEINHNDHHNNNISASEHIRPQQHSKDFSNLRKLVWLDLSSNRIHHIGANTLPKSIVTLDLSRNLLSSLPISVQLHLCDLRILHMRDNLLTNLDNVSFKGLRSHLEKVDLSQNLISSLPQNLFNRSTHVKALNFDRNFLTHLPAHAFAGTNILQHLILSYNYISDIDEHTFATLENSLEYLDLERNFLTAVPYALMNLANIRYLYLTSNHLSSVEFLPSTLRVISLSSNNFSRIPKEILANCTDLTYLNMGYNQITFIEPSTFVKWGGDLQTLLLRNNKIGNITYGAFAGLNSLKEISLSFNDIHYVHPMAFEDVSKSLKILEMSFSLNDDLQIDLTTLNELMWLGLDNNNFKTLSNDSLSTLYELTYINLSFNRLEIIPLFVESTHRNLEEIDLSYNVIGRVRGNTFSGMQSLQRINLSSNKIKCIERSSFYNLPAISHIDLSHNQLRSLSEGSFELLPNLLRIDMMFNNLATFSLKCFQHVSNVSSPMSINISNNALTHFDSELSTYLYIYSIDLSNNYLGDARAFRNIGYSLRVLYLSGNNISVLGNHALGDFPVLEILNMAHNKISTLRRQSFQGLVNLQELDLSHNQIETINIEQFSNLLQLRYLRLNNNLIKALPRELFLNTRIEFLDLSSNFLTVWPVNSFSDIGFTLRTVHMNQNFLEYLDSTMFLNTLYLSELMISSNQIKVLPDNTFSILHNLTSLDLSFNPLITTNFKELFLNTRELRFLNLKSTGLSRVPTMYLDRLMEIDLSKNSISDIDLQLYKLKHLRKLLIAENQIYNLTSFLKRLPSFLTHLDISKNPIRKLTVLDFMPVKRLEVLAMEDVKISNINAFAMLQNLRVLRVNLEHNINELIAQLHGLCELYLNVHEHRLDGRYFGKLLPNTKLNYIEITGHKLKSIAPNAFNGLARNSNLKISIRKTMISNLPANLFYALRLIPKLTIQMIDNKLLARLTGDVFYPNASAWHRYGTRNYLGGIMIEGQNSIACDCEHVWYGHWMRRWLREAAQVNLVPKEEAEKMVKRARKSTCVDPRGGKRVPFLELFSEDLLCHASALSSVGLKLNINHSYFLATVVLIFGAKIIGLFV